jgi:isoleucyl-tRNA synthetase
MSQNYKDTLNLPKTDFPMKANLAIREPEMLKAWEESNLYEQIQKARVGAELSAVCEWRRAHGYCAE